MTTERVLKVLSLLPNPQNALVLIVTGSRDWTDFGTVWAVLERIRGDRRGSRFGVILGDEPNGVDKHALEWAKAYEAPHIRCRNDGRWPSAGPRRNADMVREGVSRRGPGIDVLGVAFWQGKRERSGTLDCMTQMVQAGISVITVAANDPQVKRMPPVGVKGF